MHGIQAVIPAKRGRNHPALHDRRKCRLRSRIEHLFSKLKNWRRVAAHGWLIRRPATNRTTLPRSEPAFVWTDRHGHAHQVRSLLPIEAEHCAIVRELAELVDDLRPDAPPATRLLMLERASIHVGQIQILEHQQRDWVEHVTTIERKGARRRAGEIGGS